MINPRIIVAASLLLVLGISMSSDAAVPTEMTVQGRLTDAGGLPRVGNFTFRFAIYNVESGGLHIWPDGPPETQSITTSAEGLWTAQIGAVDSLTEDVFSGGDKWLLIMVSDGVLPSESLPRIKLQSTPYSYHIGSVDGASGGTITSKVSIGQGHSNTGDDAFVAGRDNSATGTCSSVSGGRDNSALSGYTTIGGGRHNTASVGYATVSGGYGNLADWDGATVGGGQYDTADGYMSCVPGGSYNHASGNHSMAAGRRAKALHAGSFVWGDHLDADVASDVDDQFKIRASGGVRFASEAGSAKVIGLGDHYRDNGIVAWARVTAVGTTGASEFGVASVVRNSVGNYTVTIDISAASASQLMVTATAEVDSAPSGALDLRIVSVRHVDENSFDVFVNNGSGAAVDNAFLFMATGR